MNKHRSCAETSAEIISCGVQPARRLPHSLISAELTSTFPVFRVRCATVGGHLAHVAPRRGQTAGSYQAGATAQRARPTWAWRGNCQQPVQSNFSLAGLDHGATQEFPRSARRSWASSSTDHLHPLGGIWGDSGVHGWVNSGKDG